MPFDADNRTVKLLAAIPRGKLDAEGVAPEEFRVSLSEFKGNSYLALRLFFRGQDGQFYPAPGKGCSVRLGEVEDVAAAMLEGLRFANGPGNHQAAPSREPARPTRREPRRAAEVHGSKGSTTRAVQLDAFDDLAEYRR